MSEIAPKEHQFFENINGIDHPTYPWMMFFDSLEAATTTPPDAPLDPSKDVQTDASGLLTSISNTGTGNNAMSVSPTFTGTVIANSINIGATTTISGMIDDDSFATASSSLAASSESIKAYVDAQVTAQDLDFAGDSGTGAVDLDSQTFTLAGTANEIETSAGSQTITIGLPDSVVITTALTLGVGAAGVDYALTFNGETSDGVLTWMEDEDRFQFADTVRVDTNLEIGSVASAAYDIDIENTTARIGFIQTGAPTNTWFIGTDTSPSGFHLYDATAAGYRLSVAKTSGNTTIHKNLTIGDGTAATDFTLTFDGETNDGVITWMEDEDYFQFADTIRAPLIYVTNTNHSLRAGGAGMAYETESGVAAVLGLFSADGDKTDANRIEIFGQGTVGTYPTNTEVLQMGWDSANTNYHISTGNTGTGTIRNLIIQAGLSGNHIILADGADVVTGTNLTVGVGAAGVDYTLTFDGETSDGVITWMEDEDYFKFSDDVLIDSTEKLYFNDTSSFIQDDGTDLIADSDGNITLWKNSTDGTRTTEGIVSRKPVFARTTDATVTTLDSFTVTAGYSYIVEADCIANDSTGGSVTVFHLRYKIWQSTGGDTGAIELTKDFTGDSTLDAAMDYSSGTARLRITGEASNTTEWFGHITHKSLDLYTYTPS